MKKLKSWIYRIASRLLNPPATAVQEPYGDAFWFAWPNLWEPSVMVGLRDLVQPGAVVFDIGANLGGLTSAMARLVGPRGAVCSFEASPRIFKHLQRNVVLQGHGNVTLYNRAVYHTSGAVLHLHEGSHLNDSLYVTTYADRPATAVKSIALDDFCEAAQLAPQLIKIDIEGAEMDALKGAARTLAAHTPHVLLEQDARNTECVEYLATLGYVALDLNTYHVIERPADYTPGALTRNVLLIHRTKLAQLPYAWPLQLTPLSTLATGVFTRNEKGIVSEDFTLAPGRYLLHVHLQAEGNNNSLFCGVRAAGRDQMRYQASSAHIKAEYYEWVVDLVEESACQIFFEFVDGTSDPTLRIEKVDIQRVEGVHPRPWAQWVME